MLLLRPYAIDYSLGYNHANEKANSMPEIFRPKCMPGCLPCKAHAGVTPVAPQVYAKDEGWHTPVAQRSKQPLSIHAATPTGKLTPRRRSSGLSACNAPWSACNAHWCQSKICISTSRSSTYCRIHRLDTLQLKTSLLCTKPECLGLYDVLPLKAVHS